MCEKLIERKRKAFTCIYTGVCSSRGNNRGGDMLINCANDLGGDV